MSLGSKIRTGAMVSGAFSAHKISKAQEQAAVAQHRQAAALQQQALPQNAQAVQMARAANAAERQALVAEQVAADQRRLAEQAADHARRAHFAQWRQTPDGRAYEEWRLQASQLADDILKRIRPAVEFQPKLAAAHAYDVQRAWAAHPSPAAIVRQPSQPVMAAPDIKPLILAAALIGVFILGLVGSAFEGDSDTGSGMVSQVVPFLVLVVTALVGFFSVTRIHGMRVDRAEQARLTALAEHETAMRQWHQWQYETKAAKLARATFLAGASEDPNQVPEWWEISVDGGGFLPVPEEIEAYQAWAMRQFPSPSQLPKLQRVAFKVLDAVPGGPEVQEALTWYRVNHPASS